MTIILERQPQRWTCPNCMETAVTTGEPNRFHLCRGLAGLYSPMVPAGTRARVRAVEREDYIGRSIVRRDGEGRPMSAVVTERPDGSNDVAAFPETVNARVEV